MRGAALTALIVVAIGCESRRSPELTLATTTSVANSGLFEPLRAAFAEQHGTEIRSHLVGSGLALRMLEKGDVDVAITHAPGAEESYLRAHPNWRYRKFMFNEFVLVGPPNDPAAVRGAESAALAMQRIAKSGVRFISRGDGSGTHEREEQLWAAADARPAEGRLVIAGSGMGTTLRIASETGAYTLTDRATFAQSQGTLQLVPVYQGGPVLLNTYAVTVDPPARRIGRAAVDFFVWLTEGRGREVIDNYRIRGVRGFVPWPAARPGDRPDSLPQ